MANPQISFRLSAYQLARGLKIIRTIEPNATPSSLSQLVKTLYIDYLAKTSINKNDVVTDEDIAEIHNLVNARAKSMSFGSFQNATSKASNKSKLAPVMEAIEEIESVISDITDATTSNEETESEISSVSDFSPPEDWKA